MLGSTTAIRAQGCYAATATVLGTPCGNASLSSNLPVLGATLDLTIAGAGAAIPGILFHSPATGSSVPYGGCNIYLSELNVAAFFTTNALGSATVLTSVPAQPSLCGAALVVQGVAFSGAGPVTSLGLEVTNAWRLRVGAAPPVGGGFPGSWIHGSANCSTNPDPPIQVHAHTPRTWILRQNRCLNFEAPFMYLFAGDTKALLIDTGATASATLFPLRATVQALLDAYELANSLPNLELVVAHSHSHGDHVQGDGQFIGQPNTTVVGTSLAAVQSFFGIASWPTQVVSYDLGGRTLDIVPCPGHHSTHVAFYDRETGALASGDTLYPGFLFVSNLTAYKASIDRLTAFAANNPITNVLGAHIEMTATPGVAYPYGTAYQPNEHVLPLGVQHLLELDLALDTIFGAITQVHNDFVIQVF
jgi:glyoxylase-like metal-dependent hydrolase (beta-lactamase superfamily II)